MSNVFYCNLQNCQRSFTTFNNGLHQHKIKDPLHNPNKIYSYSSTVKKRLLEDSQIPYEGANSDWVNSAHKKTPKGPQYVDVDILNSILIEERKKSNDGGENVIPDEDFEDGRTNIEEEETKMDMSETCCFNDVNPDLLKKYNKDYIKYQYKLYDEIFGVNALESENLDQFKDTMEKFEAKKTIDIENLFISQIL